MRLIVRFKKGNILLPVNYHYQVQGWIYSLLPDDGFSRQLHETGYETEKRKYKLFVFSDLLGEYQIIGKSIHFTKEITLQIGSQSEEFIQYLYEALLLNPKALIASQILEVESLQIEDLPYFSGEKEFIIRTISPVTAYTTIENYVEYFEPGTREFNNACLNNLASKALAYSLPFVPDLKIEEVIWKKKRLIRFKRTFYVAYNGSFRIRADYPTLQLLWNTGLSAKSSAGFGMISIQNTRSDVQAGSYHSDGRKNG